MPLLDSSYRLLFNHRHSDGYPALDTSNWHRPAPASVQSGACSGCMPPRLMICLVPGHQPLPDRPCLRQTNLETYPKKKGLTMRPFFYPQAYGCMPVMRLDARSVLQSFVPRA